MPKARKKPSRKEVTRLTDLDVREVSVVDRPANRRRFLVVKNLDGITLQKSLEGTMSRGVLTPTQAQNEGYEPVEKSDDLSFLDVIGLSGSAEKEPEQPPVVPIEKKKELALEETNKSVESLTSLISKVKANDEEKEQISKESVGEFSAIAKSVSELAGKFEVKVEIKKSETLATESVLKTANEALESLMDFSAKVQKVEDEVEKFDEELLNVLKCAAESLSSINEVEKKEDSTPVKTEDSTPVQEAVEDQKVQAFIEKSADGKSSEILFKVGSKIKRSRLSNLKKIHDLLGSLIKELAGEEQPSEKTTKSEPEKLDVKDLVSQVTKAIAPKLDEFGKEITKKLETVSSRIDEIESIAPTGNGGDIESEPVQKKEKGLFTGLFDI